MEFEKDLEKLIIELRELAAEYEKRHRAESGNVDVFFGKKEAFYYSAKKIENLMIWHSKRAEEGN